MSGSSTAWPPGGDAAVAVPARPSVVSRLATLSRIVVTAVFAVALRHKLANPDQFAVQIGDFGVSEALREPLAWMILALEGLAVATLLVWRRFGLALTSGLLVMFASALTFALADGLEFSCGCFGPNASYGLSAALGFDVFLLALCGFAWRCERP